MGIIFLTLQAIYFFLPAYFANMIPVFLKDVKFLDKPIWEKKLGSHKTWRGLVFGSLTGLIVFVVQKYLYSQLFSVVIDLSIIDYSDFPVAFGLLLGFGALFGDIVKSYYKRKAEIKPGEKWLIFDQIDFVIGAIVFSWFVYVPPVEIVAILLVVSPLLHILFNYLGYVLKIKKSKW